jgi:hypothetical protein
MPRLRVTSLVSGALCDGRCDAATRVVNALLDDGQTDAARAGERLLVFGWERSLPGANGWRYRIVGERSGVEYLNFTLSMPNGPTILLSMFGLQLQIALNGLERTSRGELECFVELMQESRRAAASTV